MGMITWKQPRQYKHLGFLANPSNAWQAIYFKYTGSFRVIRSACARACVCLCFFVIQTKRNHFSQTASSHLITNQLWHISVSTSARSNPITGQVRAAHAEWNCFYFLSLLIFALNCAAPLMQTRVPEAGPSSLTALLLTCSTGHNKRGAAFENNLAKLWLAALRCDPPRCSTRILFRFREIEVKLRIHQTPPLVLLSFLF